MEKDTILATLETIGEPSELTEYAAAAAAGVLADNWQYAFKDNQDRDAQRRIVLNDIELTCQLLHDFADAVRAQLLAQPAADPFRSDPAAGQL